MTLNGVMAVTKRYHTVRVRHITSNCSLQPGPCRLQ